MRVPMPPRVSELKRNKSSLPASDGYVCWRGPTNTAPYIFIRFVTDGMDTDKTKTPLQRKSSSKNGHHPGYYTPYTIGSHHRPAVKACSKGRPGYRACHTASTGEASPPNRLIACTAMAPRRASASLRTSSVPRLLYS